MIIDVNEYTDGLKKLWKNVFSDEDRYINLFFDFGYTPAECFAEVVGDEVISALYLLRCNIVSGGQTYEGRYLYAAATDEKYRGKGIMGKLIDEAKNYIVEKGIDFISLVPADEGLYKYYGRFGFEFGMYNFLTAVDNYKTLSDSDPVIDDASVIRYMRKTFLKNAFLYPEEEMIYALSCLNYAGYKFYRNSADSFYLADDEKKEILEFVSSEENFQSNAELLLSKLEKGALITSSYSFEGLVKSEKNKFGMVYYNPDKEKFSSEIYMNIALD